MMNDANVIAAQLAECQVEHKFVIGQQALAI